MFLASKVLTFVIEPLAWVLVFLTLGLLLLNRRPKLGKTLSWFALALLVVSAWTSPAKALLGNLELRYAQLPASEAHKFVGVVVLGGALAHSDIWTAHHRMALNEQAERMAEAVSLMHNNPQLKLLYTGGIASVSGTGLTEAQRARMFFDTMGVDASRVIYESASRNTYENARYSAAVPGVDKRQPWLLLTSAFHMPRSMGVFRKVGWNVTPFPVDYRIDLDRSWVDFSLHYGPALWTLTLHELLGNWAYQMADWS